MAQRVALLIATGDYRDPLLSRLRAPAQDVQALAEVLSDPDIGDFATVHTVVDRSRQDVEEAIEDCLADRKPGDICPTWTLPATPVVAARGRPGDAGFWSRQEGRGPRRPRPAPAELFPT